MKISDIVNNLPGKVVIGEEFLDREIKTAYCGDLLSRVMAHGPQNGLWITVQTHTNVIAVATLLEMACVIIPEDIPIDENTIEKAVEEEIVLISSPLSAFQLAGKLYEMGIGRDQ
ncbi:MAG: DRTGG domain-containing protein [Caldicoprobacterales bacterium]